MFLTNAGGNTSAITDWNMIIALITLIVAIASPVIVAIINNFHQAKMKRIEMTESRGMTAIENYLTQANDAVECQSPSEEYRKSYIVAILYAPLPALREMKELDYCLLYGCKGTATPEESRDIERSLISEISKALNLLK